MKTFISLVFLSLSIHLIQAQDVPGFYITPKGDTVHCDFVQKPNALFCTNKIKIVKDGKKTKLAPEDYTLIQIDSCCDETIRIIPLKFYGKMRPARIVEEGEINLYVTMLETCLPLYAVQRGSKKPKVISKGFWRKPFLKYLDMDMSRKKDLKGLKYRDMHIAVTQFNTEFKRY